MNVDGHIRTRVYSRGAQTWTRYLVTVEYPKLNGQRRRVQKSFDKYGDAKAWLNSRRKDNIYTGPVMVGELMGEWLERGSSRSNRPWEPSTADVYRHIVRAHINSRFSMKLVSDLTVDDVERLLETFETPKTARNVRGVLSSALTMAVKQGLVFRNVAQLASVPDGRKRRVEPLTVKDARKFLGACRKHESGALFIVATVLALRQSEALALTWDDVDLGKNILHVTKKTYWSRPDKSYYTGEPKSERSRRTLPFPPEIGEVFRSQKKRLALHAREEDWNENDLVFPNRTGGHLYGRVATHQLRRLLKSASLPEKRFYDLRHTGASLLRAMGVELDVIRDYLGHSDLRITTETYVHLEPETLQVAAAGMGAWMRNGGSGDGNVRIGRADQVGKRGSGD